MKQYLESTPLLDYKHGAIQDLINQRGWQELNEKNKIQSTYLFVRDEVPFGYNATDHQSASSILLEGFGQCNTKSTLLMALLRAIGIPCRIHGFTIKKNLQKGAISGIWYDLAPDEILHSWVEVQFDNNWYFLEGVILDKPYLNVIQKNFPNSESFCGFGIATTNLKNPDIDWNANHTFIQKEGIHRDFGLFDSPDEFYQRHSQNLSWLKKLFYSGFIRHRINAHIRKIRRSET